MVKKNRAQLLLIAAVLIALTIVASVILLNSVYTPQDLRTGSSDSEAAQIAGTQQELKGQLREYLNRVGVDDAGAAKPEALPYAPDGTTISNDVQNVSTLHGGLMSGTSGATVKLRVTDETTGDVVFQNSAREITNTSGNASWQMFSDVASVPRVQLNLTQLSSADTTLVANSTTSSDQWTLSVSKNGITADGNSLCTIGGDIQTVSLDLSDGHGNPVVDNGSTTERCDSVTIAEGVSGEYNLSFKGGDNTNGTYVVTADGNVNTADTSSTTAPYRRTDTTIDIEFRLVYITTNIMYVSEFELYDRY